MTTSSNLRDLMRQSQCAGITSGELWTVKRVLPFFNACAMALLLFLINTLMNYFPDWPIVNHITDEIFYPIHDSLFPYMIILGQLMKYIISMVYYGP